MPTPNNPQQRQLITAEEVSRWLRIRRQQVYQLVDAGILPVKKLGRSLRFDPVQIAKLLEDGGASFPHGWRKDPLS